LILIKPPPQEVRYNTVNKTIPKEEA